MKTRFYSESLRQLTKAGVIGALYTVITVLVGPFGNAVIQCRMSEALCVLAVFTPAAVPGLTVGCFVANLITGCPWQDILIGTLATAIGAVGARLLRRLPCLAPLPTVLANAFLIPWVLITVYGAQEGYWFFVLTVGAGEVISAYVLGMLLYFSLRKHPRMFR